MKAAIFRGYGLDGKFYTFSACTNNPGWVQSPTTNYFYPADNGVPIVYNTDFQDRRILNDYAIFKDFDTNINLPLINLVAPFTIQLMVHPKSINYASRLVDLIAADNLNYITTAFINGYLYFIIGNNVTTSVLISSQKVKLNQWTHITCMHNGTDGYIFFNGKFINGMPMINLQNVPLVNCSIGTYNFNGFIDDVRFWNYRIPDTAIISNFKYELVGNESGLIRYYKMNNTANDSTANAAHGIANNIKFSTIERKFLNLLPTSISIVNNYIDYQNSLNANKDYNLGDCYQCLPQKCYKFIAKNSSGDRLVASRCATVPQWIETSSGVFKPGDNGNVLESNWSSDIGQIIPCKTLINRDTPQTPLNYFTFNGSNSGLVLSNTSMSIGANFTFECWVYLNVKAQCVIFDFFNTLNNVSTDERLLLYYDVASESLTFVVWSSAGIIAFSKKNPIEIKTFTHVSLVYNQNIVTLLINGNIVKQVTNFPIIPTITRGFHFIGRSGIGDAVWNGKLTDIRLWSVARSLSDIKLSYLSLLSNFSNVNLIRYYNAIETSGSVAKDLSQYNQSATMQNVTRVNITHVVDSCSGCLKKQCYAFLSIAEDYVYFACCDNPTWLPARTNSLLYEPGDGTKYLRSLVGWESTAGKIFKLKNQNEYTEISANKNLIVGNCDNCLKIDTYPRIQISRIDFKLPDYNTFTTNYDSVNVYNKQVQFVGSDAEISIEYEKLSESDKLILENFYYFSDNESFYLPLDILLIPPNIQNMIDTWKTKTFKFKSEPIIKPFIMNKNFQLYDVSIILISNID